MFYVERDARGAVRSLDRWPLRGGAGERLAADDPEVQAFKNRSRGVADSDLHGVQFETALASLRVTYDALEVEIDAMPDLTAMQKAYHKARCRRGERYRRDDPVIVSALRALGATDAELDKAWAAAKDLVEGEAV